MPYKSKMHTSGLLKREYTRAEKDAFRLRYQYMAQSLAYRPHRYRKYTYKGKVYQKRIL